MRKRRYSPAAGLALLEDDHAPDRFAALEVADVVALDPGRRAGQPERLGQLLERGQRLALVHQPACLLLREGLGGVARRECHQLALLAALGELEVHRAAAAVGEERLEVGDVVGHGRQVDLARDGGRARVVLLDEAGDDLVVARLAHGLEQEDVAADELAGADREELHGGLVVLAREPDQVELGPRERGHLLALHRPLDGADLVAQRGRGLVVGPLGGRRHLALQRGHERLLPALEEQLHLGDVGAVVVLRDGLDAGALALLDVVQEARSLERPLAVLDLDGAGPEREEPADEVHRLVDAGRRRVRPEVAAAVVGELARAFHAREVVTEGDLDVRVALVVLEADVEARLEPLDEVRFEEERLRHGVGDGVLDLRHPVDDAADAVDLARRRRLLPVGADPVAQALRLADVDHVATVVLHEVDARPVRESLERGFERGGHPSMLDENAGPGRDPGPAWGVAERVGRGYGPAGPSVRPSMAGAMAGCAAMYSMVTSSSASPGWRTSVPWVKTV